MDRNDLSTQLRQSIDQRVALETRLQNEPGELSQSSMRDYDASYQTLQRQLATMFKQSTEDQQRVTVMLEMMRILENRLVYLQNFIVDPTSENRVLAQLVTRFIDDVSRDGATYLTSLEAMYYRAVAALYAGDLAKAREGFGAACASEESDEANDIKYKSYVILGHLSHEEADYAKAKHLHDQSMRYSPNSNVTAQALALKALNAYALGDHDDALHLFEESLGLFDENQPFFNSYFYRNALLFCGAIYFDRHDYEKASSFYRRVAGNVDQSSFDFFDAHSHLGRIAYAQEQYEEAVAAFERAVETHRLSENEYVVDTWFWLARCHMRRNDSGSAKKYLEKIAASDVRYERKPQAMQMLERIA